ncbi:MAG: YicC/YloC family endoribonuclease [Pseudomonadota bacterium]
MTGFASAKGAFGGYDWTCEIRSVNAKGLDIRLRVPDWLTGLETALRGLVGGKAVRGSINLTLRLSRTDTVSAYALNTTALDPALDALAQIDAAARARGLDPAPWTAADVLQVRGVYEPATDDGDAIEPLVAHLTEALTPLLSEFAEMRRSEGAALVTVMQGQLQQIETLTAQAAELAEARKPAVAEALRSNLARVMDGAERADPDRVAQELAMIAVKADVTEEIDRLGAHIAAARGHLDANGPIGRKLDFLMQEFNREANTLCSKSQSSDLTAVGLELKAVIDQMREQVQNVE